jgi:anti-sigma factor RsiW
MRDKGIEGERDRGIERDRDSASCGELRSRLQEYVTRELDRESRRLFDAHLVECVECQRELALMTAVVSTLEHQTVLEPSSDFSRRVLVSLPRQRRALLLSPWWSLALAPLLAGLVWLFRAPLERGIAGLLGRFVPNTVALPALTMQSAGIAAAAVVGLGLLVAAGGAVFCWRVYLQE